MTDLLERVHATGIWNFSAKESNLSCIRYLCNSTPANMTGLLDEFIMAATSFKASVISGVKLSLYIPFEENEVLSLLLSATECSPSPLPFSPLLLPSPDCTDEYVKSLGISM